MAKRRSAKSRMRVVGHHQHPAALLTRQPLQQLDDLATRAAIEGRGGFIGQQQAGRAARARAMATRCFCPPERSWGTLLS